MLEEFLGKPEVAPLLAKDLVICGIDQDVMSNGKLVASAIRDGKEGGIPWFVIFEPSKSVLKQTAAGNWQRREAAILATADSPEGNIGAPMSAPEREHFLKCLVSASKSLSDDELMYLAEQQRLFAAARNEKYAAVVDVLPTAPSFTALVDDFDQRMNELGARFEAAQKGEGPMPEFPDMKVEFNNFRNLSKNLLASPNDRGQAKLWCFQNFFMAGIKWKKPGEVLTGLADGLIENWADAPWATGFAASIANFAGQPGFAAADVLRRLEKKVSAKEAKIEVAYRRAMMWKELDPDQWIEDIEVFQKAYPDSKQAQKAQRAAATKMRLKVGELAPQLEGQDVNGKTITLADYKGKVTYLVFWGFW